MQNLRSSGVTFRKSSKRDELLHQVLRNHGISLDGDKLTVIATETNYATKKHMLLQTMIAVDDMFIAERNSVKNMFADDVGNWLDSHIFCILETFQYWERPGALIPMNIIYRGRHKCRSVFAKPINKLNETNRNIAIFNWLDTVEKRKDAGKLLVFINDEEEVLDEDINAFTVYGINPILWAKREKYLDLVAN